MSPSGLEKLYRSYLLSGLDPQAGINLCDALEDVGLRPDASALRRFFERGAAQAGDLYETRWNNRRCFVGQLPPAQPEPGHVWLDAVELTPMILVPHPDDDSLESATWLAARPVHVWQFRAFLGLARVGRQRIEFAAAPDYLDAKRFAQAEATSFVTDIYQDEALAYAHWFGKVLAGQFDLQTAASFLTPEEFSVMLPPNVCLWDEAEFPRSEFVRIAFGRRTLDKTFYAEARLREAGEHAPAPERMLFEEWDRRDDIGLATAVSFFQGLIQATPRSTIFFDLLNAAPRPETGGDDAGDANNDDDTNADDDHHARHA